MSIGWLDVNKFDQTKDEQASQGWAPFVLDTNGNGRRDAGWVEPNGRVDPTKDKRIVVGPLWRQPESGGRHGVGLGARLPGRRAALRSRRRS